MRQDQLQQARLARWRQDGNALLTLDDAERWLADTPLCLYLPRQQHLPVPAPSFVEAIAGRPDPTPGPEQIAAAAQMLARLVASGAVIALNLFGVGPGGFVGEQPDFLATPEALPYLYALQPERNPKREPSTVGGSRVSPLAAEAHKILEREGALTTIELRSRLGREVTEAAVLRALAELWHTMRVVPVPDESGGPAHWELLSARHRRELNIGSTQSQTTALSILVSFYLQSAVAASQEQAEIFLSPVASRSRIRDVVHGLSTTRQLGSFPLNGEGHLYVEGSLPELPEETVELAATTQANADLDAGLEQNEPSFAEAAAVPPIATPRISAPRRSRDEQRRPERPDQERRAGRPKFADRARGRFTPRDRGEASGERPPRREGGFRSPERRGSGGVKPSFRAAAGSSERPHRERPGRERPNRERPGRPPFARADRPARPGGFERPRRTGEEALGQGNFEKRTQSDRPKRGPERAPGRTFGRGSDRTFDKRKSGFGQRDKFQKRDASGRPPQRSFGNRGPARPSEGSERRPFQRSEERRPFKSARPDRPFRKPEAAGEGRPPRRDGDRPYKRPYTPAGQRPPRRGPVSSGENNSRPDRGFKPRDSGERRPFRKEGTRPGGFSRPSGRPATFSKPGYRKPFGARPTSAAGDRPRPDQGPDRGSDRGGDHRPDRRPARPFSSRPENRSPDTRKFTADRKPDAAGRPSRPGKFGPAKSAPGKFGRSGPARPGGRPPNRGNFKPAGKRPGFKPGANRPGGFAPPRRKPRGESREGDEG